MSSKPSEISASVLILEENDPVKHVDSALLKLGGNRNQKE